MRSTEHSHFIILCHPMSMHVLLHSQRSFRSILMRSSCSSSIPWLLSACQHCPVCGDSRLQYANQLASSPRQPESVHKMSPHYDIAPPSPLHNASPRNSIALRMQSPRESKNTSKTSQAECTWIERNPSVRSLRQHEAFRFAWVQGPPSGS